MNVPQPLEDRETAFAVLTVIVVALAATTFLLIRFSERIGPRPGRRS